MKTNKTTLVGVLCAAGCALCIAFYLATVRGEVDEARAEALARYGGDQIEVCVAKRDLAAGEVVDEGSIATKLWVADLLPEGAVTDAARIVGQRLGSAIYKGEVICARRTETSQSVLEVPPGKAAISVPAQAVQAVGGSVEPGMAVDVYATGPSATAPLVQGALVLASSATEEAASSTGDWITLAVDPERVQEVVAAAQNLQLYFVLPALGASATSEEEASGSAEVPPEDAASSAAASEASGLEPPAPAVSPSPPAAAPPDAPASAPPSSQVAPCVENQEDPQKKEAVS